MKKLFFLALVFLGVFYYLSSNETKLPDPILINTGGGNNKNTNKTNNTVDLSKYSDEEVQYFKEVALKSEYSDINNGQACKWTSDMNIFVKGDKSEVLMSELNRIVGELNGIINTINVNIVDDPSQANYTIYFGNQYGYQELEPASVGYTENNWGLFVVPSGTTITNGTMYVDTERCTSIDAQKHLLREELTQSLGLFNDSDKYPNSIFQQAWTETTEYSEIDIKMIHMLYNN